MCFLIMDLIIDEGLIDKFIEMTSINGEQCHKGIHHLLKDIRMLGYLHRGGHNILLEGEEGIADLSAEYSTYLDKRAAGIKTKFISDNA